jgi:hypothetical protein
MFFNLLLRKVDITQTSKWIITRTERRKIALAYFESILLNDIISVNN